VSVEFTDHDGGVLQCNPYALQLDEPMLFEGYPPGYPELGG
jgi:hypothetical protein